MFSVSVMVVMLSLGLPAPDQVGPQPTPVAIEPGAASECILAAARGNMTEALTACREAVERGATEPRVLDTLAEAELEEGDPAKAEEIWRKLIADRGWRWDFARGLARALWRRERTQEAEKVLRDAVKRDPSPEVHNELIGFYLSFSRWKDAAELARTAIERFPKNCTFHEDLGIADAGLGKDAAAAAAIRKALELGCPALRWPTRGEIPHRIHRAEYRPLLDARQLAKNLSRLPEGEAVHHLRLLELVLDPSVTEELGRAALDSSSAKVKLASLFLLQRLGKAAAPQWRRILAASDIMLRKHALRMLARSDEPWLLPILEDRLTKERAPHNLSLVRIAVARRIAARQPERAETLLKAVPEDDPSHFLAVELLGRLPRPTPADLRRSAGSLKP